MSRVLLVAVFVAIMANPVCGSKSEQWTWDGLASEGDDWLTEGKFQKAHKWFQMALKRCPDEKKWLVNTKLALVYEGFGVYKKAIEYAEAAAEGRYEEDPWLHFFLATTYPKEQRWLDAVVTSIFTLVKFDLQESQNAALREVLFQAAENIKEDVPVIWTPLADYLDLLNEDQYYELGNLLFEGEHYDSASDIFQYGLRSKPEDSHQFFSALGMCKLKQKEYELAEMHFNLGIKMVPDCVQCSSNKAAALFYQDRYKDAISIYGTITSQHGNLDWNVYFNFASCLFNTGKFKAAILCFLAAIKRNKDISWVAHYHLAECYKKILLLDKALKHLGIAGKDPSDASEIARLEYIHLLCVMGKFKKIGDALEMASGER
ncbi:MAG: tetratricopeptide repeat protein [Alphaproteobacteria bacterium]